MGEKLRSVGESASSSAADAASSVKERLSGLGESIGNAAGTVSDSISSATESIAGATGAVSDQARRLGDRFSDLMQQQPLLVGAVALTLGAILGYALPATDTEDRLMGSARDASLDKAKEVASEQLAGARQAMSAGTADSEQDATPDQNAATAS